MEGDDPKREKSFLVISTQFSSPGTPALPFPSPQNQASVMASSAIGTATHALQRLNQEKSTASCILHGFLPRNGSSASAQSLSALSRTLRKRPLPRPSSRSQNQRSPGDNRAGVPCRDAHLVRPQHRLECTNTVIPRFWRLPGASRSRKPKRQATNASPAGQHDS